MKKLILVGLALLSWGFVFAGNGDQLQADDLLQKQDQLFFIENKGQWHSDVLYLCRMGRLDAWITKYGVNYTFYKIEKDSAKQSWEENELLDRKYNSEQENEILLGHRVLLQYVNHNPNPATEGSQKQIGYYNYFIGNDTGKHATNVSLYKEVTVKNVYHGIDIRYYFDRGCLRYDYFVQPGADPGQIKFEFKGANDEYLKAGDLCYTTRFGEVLMAELKSLQENKEVASQFERTGKSWQLKLGPYCTSKPLIIDPLLYSTYIGGNTSDQGFSIALDALGNTYITGITYSSNYDITPGSFQTLKGGLDDVFVTKLNSTGTDLLYSTYIGGSSIDQGYSIALDSSGNAYITGLTYSTNYDFTMNAFQTTNEGDSDVFVTKLNSTGTALLYSTYIGGSSEDMGRNIALDALGNAYITGHTFSTDYDICQGAFQTTIGGLSDVFVTKLNSTGTALLYSTYIGGSNYESKSSIVLDATGNAYITGKTSSTDYDIIPGAFQTTIGGLSDVFVTKINSTGTALLYSTYIGGSSSDLGYSIALDVLGNAYITGFTQSTDYDISPSAFQTTCGGEADIFVTLLNSTGTAVLYSTYVGGSARDYGFSIALDGQNNVYITGLTYSTDYDISPGAFQTTNDGYTDLFVTKINSTGTALLYSTYLGGSGEDAGYSIALDVLGNAYITGFTQSTDYDISPSAFQTTIEGSTNLFVTKLALCLDAPAQPSSISGNTIPCEAATETYSVTLVEGVTYTWTLPTDWTQTGGGNTNSITVTVGEGSGNIAVTPSNGCGIGVAQTLAVATTPLPEQPGAINGPTAPCEGTSQNYSITNVVGVTYTWSFPAGWTQTGGGTTNSVTVTVGANSGDIIVTPSISCGNGTAQTLAVVPDPLLQASAIIGNATPCEAATETYSVAVVDSVTYTWTFPVDWTLVDGESTNSVTLIVGPCWGDITCTLSNECGNSAAQTLAVMSSVLPAQPSTITGSTTPCQGSLQSYSVTSVAGVTYTWTFPVDWTQIIGGTTNSVTVIVGAESGNIIVTPSNECGNGDSSPNLNVTVATIPATPTITYHGDTLTSSAITGNQWYKGGVAIAGATGQYYVTTESGTYSVIVTINGCSSDESEPFIITSNTGNMNELATLLIQPNPNNGKFQLTAKVAKRQICTLEIISSTGAIVYQEEGLVVDGNFSKEVDITGTSTGVYMVILRNSDNQVIRKMVLTH